MPPTEAIKRIGCYNLMLTICAINETSATKMRARLERENSQTVTLLLQQSNQVKSERIYEYGRDAAQ
ncbi:hypothetical protein Zmor_006764 [Zophobas morio]|uniref:Uncharacterized protein n=1 Tax=Zophobas morio TaxID=2755281 RepID=A0AA38J0K5_9CUCU|nr:hypothetical protein Zmor_006764 [Zophobas morio]